MLAVIFLRPPALPIFFMVLLIGSLLEAGSAFCVVYLTLFPQAAMAQAAMFAQQVRSGHLDTDCGFVLP
jgi:hypothetical protein